MVGQRETGAGGVAIGFGREVDADLVIGEPVQEKPREAGMRLLRQALPIGRVMALDLGLDGRLGPVLERVAQRGLALLADILAVEILQPALERIGGLAVQRAQQLRFPVVPGVGPDAADIADCQHGQQVQPLARFHRLGEIGDRARVGDVAFLRHVGHDQMRAHQPFDRLDLFLGEPEPLADRARDPGAEDRMVLLPALADIVQEDRQIEDLAVDPAS